MVNKNTVQIYRPWGSSVYRVRIPRIVIFGYCLVWSCKFKGTLDECTEYCVRKYNMASWKMPWIYGNLLYGNS